MQKKLKILISNDDGITSAGIFALAKSLSEIAEITVVAPQTEQSAVGHSITMKMPLRINEHFINDVFFGYAIDGTPADCIKIGIKNILHYKPDLVVSGINNGSNAAINIIYSGTVSAAREAAIMDVPAIAFSVTNWNTKDFTIAAEYAKELIQKISPKKIPLGTLLNVNIPDLPKEEIKGVLVTKQGKTKWDDNYEERIDTWGRKYYWLEGEMVNADYTLEFDQFALMNNYISITPIHFDLTDYGFLEELKSWGVEEK